MNKRINPNLIRLAELTHNPDLKETSILAQKVDDPNVSGEFSINNNPNFWAVTGVNYRDGIYHVDLQKELLDNGDSKTQDQWSEYSKTNEFKLGDFPLYHSLFQALYQNRDSSNKHLVEQAKQFIKEKMFKNWLMTLTRIKYMPSPNKDIVIHNYKMPDQYNVSDDFVGPDEWVKKLKEKNTFKALLGSDNLQEINNIYKWITEKDAHIWRVNSKLEKQKERVAGFVAFSGRALLSCAWDPRGSYSGLGVRIAKIKE